MLLNRTEKEFAAGDVLKDKLGLVSLRGVHSMNRGKGRKWMEFSQTKTSAECV